MSKEIKEHSVGIITDGRLIITNGLDRLTMSFDQAWDILLGHIDRKPKVDMSNRPDDLTFEQWLQLLTKVKE